MNLTKARIGGALLTVVYTRGFSNTAVIPANPFAVYGAVQLSLGSRP